MKFHSKKAFKEKGKSICNDSNLLHIQNESMISEIPMKAFKGTKYHLEECKNDEKEKKLTKKRKEHPDSNELHLEKEKKSKYDPLQLMSKLEKFSDVWNDCPDVENPKSSFEIVPNHTSESKLYNKAKKVEHKSKEAVGHETSKWSIPNGSGKAHYREKSSLKTNHKNHYQTDYQQNSYESKSKILELKGNQINNFKDEIVEDDHTTLGKYDSKVAELKRKKAVQEQSQLYADQKNIIKKALSSMEGKQQVNKKIVFSDAEDNAAAQIEVNLDDNKTKTQKLFDDDSSESDFELKVNNQFKGKKGQKLLELQSKFASDSRFTLDSRFHESDSENEKDEDPSNNLDIQEEKKRQLEILESIVNQSIRPLSERKNVPGKRYNENLMVRFDPTREDHQKYLLNTQKPPQEEEPKEKKIKKSKKESKALLNDQERKPEVSSEKIYDVKEDLKQVLKKEDKTEFSLLKLFGSKDDDSNTQQEGSESIKKLKYATKNPFRYDSSQSESEGEESKKKGKKKHTNVVKPSLPSWRTTFFFTENDSRLKEAEEFLKVPEEPEGEEEYAEKRKLLKDFIRHKLRNNNHKKNPFKRKLGGIKNKSFHKKKGK